MKKIIFALVLFAMVFFAGAAQAQYYTITSHTIDITIDEEGFALISEKFYLNFPNNFQLEEFRQKNAEIGISLEGWKQFDNRIHIYIGGETELNRAEVGFVETNGQYLEIKYSLNKPVAEKKSETSRIIEFALLPKFFDSFLQSGVFIIPENTAISINLPSSAEIENPAKPEGILAQNKITWQGYKSSNVLQLQYRLVKDIASISLAEILQGIINSPLFIVLIIILVIICVFMFVKRKAISERIENYIVDHSELGSKETLEEETEQKQ